MLKAANSVLATQVRSCFSVCPRHDRKLAGRRVAVKLAARWSSSSRMDVNKPGRGMCKFGENEPRSVFPCIWLDLPSFPRGDGASAVRPVRTQW
jgi:hypothetical protein